MITISRYESMVADVIGRRVEKETGRVELTFFSDTEQEMLEIWWREGVKPKDAAEALLAIRAATPRTKPPYDPRLDHPERYGGNNPWRPI